MSRNKPARKNIIAKIAFSAKCAAMSDARGVFLKNQKEVSTAVEKKRTNPKRTTINNL